MPVSLVLSFANFVIASFRIRKAIRYNQKKMLEMLTHNRFHVKKPLVPREQFTHFYKLLINSSLADIEVGRITVCVMKSTLVNFASIMRQVPQYILVKVRLFIYLFCIVVLC